MGYLSRIHRGRKSTAGGGLEREGSGIPKQDTQGAGSLQQVGD